MSSSNSLTIVDDYHKVKHADKKAYRSLPIMTKYEFNEVIALRVTQLSKGAPPFVDIPEDFTIQGNMALRAIAIQELKEKKLPFIVKRGMPNGKMEYISVADLNLTAVEHLFRD